MRRRPRRRTGSQEALVKLPGECRLGNRYSEIGEVREWLIRAVNAAVRATPAVGSNPTLSANMQTLVIQLKGGIGGRRAQLRDCLLVRHYVFIQQIRGQSFCRTVQA